MSDQTDVRPSRRSASTACTDTLAPLVELVVQRLTLCQEVAAAKYTSSQPIDDPAREHEILQAAARALNGRGRHQKLAIRFLRDQLEANKVVSADSISAGTRTPRKFRTSGAPWPERSGRSSTASQRK